ncbi:unnamed protein product [Symbiodinium microadriaticum]|nr:unnamed protein product [Symbiodinium microadriaticum]
MFIDVKKAHFWSPVRSVYGTRAFNSQLGKGDQGLRLNVHGDDFAAVGGYAQLQWLQKELKRIWAIDARGKDKGRRRRDTAHERGISKEPKVERLVQLLPNQDQFTCTNAGRQQMAKQAVIALSTGEAEYDGLISAASAALGEQAMMADWGIRLPVTVPKVGEIPGLSEWLQELCLEEYEEEVVRWCKSMGAIWLEKVQENAEDTLTFLPMYAQRSMPAPLAAIGRRLDDLTARKILCRRLVVDYFRCEAINNTSKERTQGGQKVVTRPVWGGFAELWKAGGKRGQTGQTMSKSIDVTRCSSGRWGLLCCYLAATATAIATITTTAATSATTDYDDEDDDHYYHDDDGYDDCYDDCYDYCHYHS